MKFMLAGDRFMGTPYLKNVKSHLAGFQEKTSKPPSESYKALYEREKE